MRGTFEQDTQTWCFSRLFVLSPLTRTHKLSLLEF